MTRAKLTDTAKNYVSSNRHMIADIPLIEQEECYARFINDELLTEDVRFYFSELLRFIKELHNENHNS